MTTFIKARIIADMDADLRGNKSFTNRVLSVVQRIPRGKVFTYKEVAGRAGSPKAYRAVGNILKKNCDPAVPCHRVIRSDGKPGEYNRGIKEKIRILKKEGAIA